MSPARHGDGIGAEVRRKDLQCPCIGSRLRIRHLPERHRQRVGFLAGRAADDPGPQPDTGSSLRQQIGQHPVREFLPHRRIAKEAGDADQQLLEEQIQFLGIFAYEAFVGRERIEAVHPHAPLDASFNRADSCTG
jgi:hypothetical protein